MFNPKEVGTIMTFFQWNTLLVGAAMLLLLQSNVHHTNGHNLGEHGLTGEEPTGDPNLPEITGPFEIELKVRYNAASPHVNTLLDYADPNSGKESISFHHTSGSGVFQMHVYVGGALTYCVGLGTVPTIGTVHTVKFAMDATGKASIAMDGTLITECPGMNVPTNTARVHTVGGLMYASTSIVGLRVTNLSTSTSVLDRFKFMNLPGQPRSHAFVANFYARFDDLTAALAQQVFSFANGLLHNSIGCSQRQNSNDMECFVEEFHAAYRVIAANSIVQGEFAFWHFGVDSDGTMWISKDGVLQVTQAEPTLVLPDVFRKELLFGESYVPGQTLDGVVLGFRLDRGEPMTTSR